jgi:choline dehydrogenase-like flavoprotein
MTMTHRPYHFVAIVGGAIAGSVAAEILADNGIQVVVIEQNKKPYGKIEDGLPRWHLEQRKQEYSRIDALSRSLRRRNSLSVGVQCHACGRMPKQFLHDLYVCSTCFQQS